MKQEIKPEDIRKGDLIRWEREEQAHEWRAHHDGDLYDRHSGRHFLLNRPAPPFTPKDGMIISGSEDGYFSAVRINGEWLGYDPDDLERHWFPDFWAEKKMENGWWIYSPDED